MASDLNDLPKWHVETDKNPIGFLLSSKSEGVLSHDELVNVSAEIIRLDNMLIRSNVKEFDYWQASLTSREKEVAYIQMLDGRRIVDARYIVSLVLGTNIDGDISRLLSSVKNSASLIKEDHQMAVISLERYKQIILNPRYNPEAREISPENLERVVDEALEKYRNEPFVDSVKKGKLTKYKDMLIPDPYSITHDSPVELHKGVFVSVGTQYIKGNPFEQFLYMTIDTEEGKIVKIAGSSLVKHATYINGKGISSPDSTRQLRKEIKLSEEVIDV